ncbi:hypothetical protein OQA88_5207 [Cercophora sp. LCS_1]
MGGGYGGDGSGFSRIKIHPRCVKDVEKLKLIVESLTTGAYTIEIRHNMYIIRSTEPLSQNEIVKRLLDPTN